MRARHRHFNARDAGASLVLDARYIAGLANAAAIGTWADRSRSGNDATQATEANKPTYRTNILNGNPVVRFDGTNDSLTSNAQVNQPSAFMAVWHPSSGGLVEYLVDGLGGSNRQAVIAYSIALGSEVVVFAGSELFAGTRTESFQIVSAVFNGSSSSLTRNGSVAASGNAGAQNTTGTKIGSRFNNEFYLNGEIAMLLLMASPSAPLRKRCEHSSAFSFKIACS